MQENQLKKENKLLIIGFHDQENLLRINLRYVLLD